MEADSTAQALQPLKLPSRQRPLFLKPHSPLTPQPTITKLAPATHLEHGEVHPAADQQLRHHHVLPVPHQCTQGVGMQVVRAKSNKRTVLHVPASPSPAAPAGPWPSHRHTQAWWLPSRPGGMSTAEKKDWKGRRKVRRWRSSCASASGPCRCASSSTDTSCAAGEEREGGGGAGGVHWTSKICLWQGTQHALQNDVCIQHQQRPPCANECACNNRAH